MNHSEYSHLSKNATEALNLPNDTRIEKIKQSKWIGYTRARNILDKMEDLLYYPPKHRMPNLLIVGDTNNGKTMIIKRFLKFHPPDENLSGNAIIAPVILIQAPPTPDEGRFYNAILEHLFAPYKPNDRVDKKQAQVIRILKTIGLKMLIIDEIQHILAGNMNKQRQFLNVIKFLGNELMIPIVAVGTKDAFRAIQTDPQLSNRFEPALLPHWDIDTEFLQLLASFEKILPLKKPSNLTNKELALNILSKSEGTIGEISSFLTLAAIEAIKNGQEYIDSKLINKLNWIAPSDRQKVIIKL